MAMPKIPGTTVLIFLTVLLAFVPMSQPAPSTSKLFRAYIGSQFKNVKFSDVPIYQNVEFHFILAFAIDYTTSPSSPSPTNGRFNIFWDTDNLSPSQVTAIKRSHPNVKVALSLGGNSVGPQDAYFRPASVSSWVANAVSSLTGIIRQYNLDGIDIDYEHFDGDLNTFVECIGQLITTLKRNRVISIASIAPYDDPPVQNRYLALWKRYGHVIDYINYQFYAYDQGTTVDQFIGHFEEQRSKFIGGKVLVSYISNGKGGLSASGGFFTACNRLKSQNQLQGIFVWCADDSKDLGFRYEKQSQSLLAR